MQVKWTEPAARALESIQNYIAKDKPSAAFEVVQKMRYATEQLNDHSKLGMAGRLRGTYELVISSIPYIVPYRVKGKEVHILSVYHASRKWPEAFE